MCNTYRRDALSGNPSWEMLQYVVPRIATNLYNALCQYLFQGPICFQSIVLRALTLRHILYMIHFNFNKLSVKIE
jgi:hypothetical protein